MRSILLVLFYLVHTTLLSVAIVVVGCIGFCVPFPRFQKACSRVMVEIASTWADYGSSAMGILLPTEWEITGVEALDPQKSYLIIANHRSWADILVLYRVFIRKIPFLRYFIKKELLHIPLIGWVWRMLHFPRMHRYSKAYLAKHPEMKGKDIESTRAACEKFREVPISLVNFVEGTRFTREKHALKNSAFTHLLPPKAGGAAYTLMTLGSRLDAILDVTIVYSPMSVTLWDLFAGRVQNVKVVVRMLPLTPELTGDYENDLAYRTYFQEWINTLWQKKDQSIVSECLQ